MNKMNIKKRFSKILAAILTFAMILAFIPGGIIAPQTVSADDNTLDLSNVPSGSGDVYTYDRFMVDTTEKVIIVTGSEPVTIMGDGRSGGWSVYVESTAITIAAGTKIASESRYALNVLIDAVVTGQGADISINGISVIGYGDITIAGKFGDIITNEYYGIYGQQGVVTISGSIGNIASRDNGIQGDRGVVITATGSIGSITGNERNGIRSENGDVTIEGKVGNITGQETGIYAGGDIAITDTGEVGDITSDGDYGYGIACGGEITISGKVRDIKSASGIGANGNVTIEPSGSIGNITISLIGLSSSSSGDVNIKGTVGNITSATGSGISVRNGDITITGTGEVGNITGNMGINSNNGDVNIESGGKVGHINADAYGISGFNSVIISGTVGDIASNSSYGIGSETGNVTVTGTVGNVSSAQDYGIYSRTGSIAIAGSVTAAGAYGAFNKAPIITAGAMVTYGTNSNGTGAVTVSAGSYIWDSSHRYVKTAATGITIVTITGLSITDSAYSGSPHPGYTGSPIFTGGTPTNPTLTVLYSSASGGSYSSSTPPTDPGDYRVTVTLSGDTAYFGQWTGLFTIEGTPGNTILLPETPVSDLTEKYGAGTTVKDRNDKTLNSEEYVGTGAVITLPDDSKLTIIVYGDLIGSGRVLTDSVVALARHIAGLESLDGDAALLEAADVNGDGRINIADLIRLARYIAKIDTSNLGGF